MSRLNKSAVWAIARKDIFAMRANIQVWLPMLIVPLIIGVIVPAGLIGAVVFGGIDKMKDVDVILSWIEHLPSATVQSLQTIDRQLTYLVANYMIAPFFLLIPLMASSVMTADSFAGEKERGTLETLLFSPVDLLSLFTGKVLAGFLPGLVLSYGTFVMTAITLNAVGWPLFGRLFFPSGQWIPLMLLVIPMLSLTAVLINVFLSARVATFQAAYQLGGLVVLPVVLLIVGQMSGLLFFGTRVITFVGIVLLLLNFLLLSALRARLDRQALFESQVH